MEEVKTYKKDTGELIFKTEDGQEWIAEYLDAQEAKWMPVCVSKVRLSN